MLLGVPRLKRAVSAVVLMVVSFALVSCGAYNNPSTTLRPAKVRAFVSQDVFSPTALPGLITVDASLDRQASGGTISTGNSPGILVVSPNRKVTLAIGTSDNTVSVVDNATDRQFGSAISLPDFTESVVVSLDATTGYAAVPNASVFGQSPGAVEVMNLGTSAITTSLPVPGAHYVVQSHNGNRILALSDKFGTVTVIATSLIGTSNNPSSPVPGFDHPVSGIFSSDDNKAYILNCGPECGGQTASVQVLDLTTDPPTAGSPLAVRGATIGFLSRNTLYVAGTPPGTPCGSGTAAPTCGTLDAVDVSSMTVTTQTPIITDGYHNRIDLGANGKLFIGAHTCSNINIAGEVRGCLSIFNTSNGDVAIPPDNGDVTGIQAIANRNVVYVVQNGELSIYDTTTDQKSPNQVDIIGQAVDVKMVD